MIADIIKNLLNKYRKGISEESMFNILKNKNISISSIEELMQKQELFKLHNGIVFLKSTLIKTKKDFLKEFDDFMQGKIQNKELRKNLIKLFIIYIPDELFIEWIDISLDKKLIIFDLLMSIMFKTENKKNRLKLFFNELIEFYSLIAIYTMLLLKNFEKDFKIYLKKIQEIESLEETIKTYFFNILTIPEKVKSNLITIKDEFKSIENKINKIIVYTFFINIKNYSSKLFKRVIENELKEFDILQLLTRFKYKTLYEWIMVLHEEKIKPHKNLFDDLGF